MSEIAYLCAIPNRPETYDPFKNPATALVRRNKILRAMRDIGQISNKKCKKAIQEKIKVQSQKKNKIYNYPTTYTVHCAVEYLMKKEGFNFEYSFSSKSDYETYKEKYQKVYQKWHTRLKTGGYKIKTSINLKKQREIQQIVNDTLSFDKTKNNGEYNLQGAVTVIDNQTGKVISIIHYWWAGKKCYLFIKPGMAGAKTTWQYDKTTCGIYPCIRIWLYSRLYVERYRCAGGI